MPLCLREENGDCCIMANHCVAIGIRLRSRTPVRSLQPSPLAPCASSILQSQNKIASNLVTLLLFATGSNGKSASEDLLMYTAGDFAPERLRLQITPLSACGIHLLFFGAIPRTALRPVCLYSCIPGWFYAAILPGEPILWPAATTCGGF